MKGIIKGVGALFLCVVLAYLFSFATTLTGILPMLVILSFCGGIIGMFVLLELVNDHVDTES
ncbi:MULTISPECIES: hypothetical protein [Shouchella]|uniref:Uncharacterized protein n=2 Tax=Shouchella TaxID=2893057 RepID=A0ABY7W837_9BACI|nr:MULTISPECIES: hypothetical protein [Shouchella]MED4128618.1 hypothetical protein [Shouchella miscanthi]WDF04776.1 hypothetical protein PQ477_04770 [Shouchella hunanensis]GAF22003.1 hypothetical protein JCM19047_1732 [Bacillus sp. JCM 19047]